MMHLLVDGNDDEWSVTQPVAGNDGIDDDAHQGIASIDQHCSVHATAVLFESPLRQPAALKANSGGKAAQNFFGCCAMALSSALFLGLVYSIMDKSKLNPIPKNGGKFARTDLHAAGPLG